MPSPDVASSALASLGLTQTEASAYLALLQGGPATGYEVARRVSIARANTYAALEALAQRRLVERDSGRPSQFAAVEPAALIGRLAANFASRLDELQLALERLSRAPDPPPPVLDRIDGDVAARAAVERLGARATRRVMARLPEPALKAFEPFSRGLARRGVTVDTGPTPGGKLGYVVVDDRWAAVWLAGGTGLWGDEPLLVAVAQELLGA